MTIYKLDKQYYTKFREELNENSTLLLEGHSGLTKNFEFAFPKVKTTLKSESRTCLGPHILSLESKHYTPLAPIDGTISIDVLVGTPVNCSLFSLFNNHKIYWFVKIPTIPESIKNYNLDSSISKFKIKGSENKPLTDYALW